MTLHYGAHVEPARLLAIAETDTIGSILRLMGELGLKGKVVRNRMWSHLAALGSSFPAMAEQKDGRWFIVTYVGPMPDGQSGVTILYPEAERSEPIMIPREEFVEIWSGKLVVCRRVYSLTDESQPFGMRWFMPEIIRHGRFIVAQFALG